MPYSLQQWNTSISLLWCQKCREQGMPEGHMNHKLKPQNRGVRIQSRTGKDAHTVETKALYSNLKLKKKKKGWAQCRLWGLPFSWYRRVPSSRLILKSLGRKTVLTIFSSNHDYPGHTSDKGLIKVRIVKPWFFQ